MADRWDAQADELKAALAALAEDGGKALPAGYLGFCAAHIAGASDPDQFAAHEDRFRRLEAFVEAAHACLLAFEALDDDDAENIYADYRLPDTLRLVAVRAMGLAAQKPQRKPGRRPKLHALDVARRALTAYEIVTGRRASIVVDAISGTAGGAYLGLVETALRILSVQASPEHYARQAIREHRDS